MKNYISLGKTLLGNWVRYVYLDTDEVLVQSLLRRHMIHVKLEGIMERENEPYRLVALKVLKKDERKFLQAMEELKGKMLLFGHLDYESRGGELLEETRGILRQQAEETGRVDLPAGGSIRASEVGL